MKSNVITGSLALVAISALFLNRSTHILPVPGLNAITLKEWNPKDTTLAMPVMPRKMPALMVKRSDMDTSSSPLKMTALKMEVKILGNIATTTMEMSFYNDLDRNLEGQLVFPLADGQKIHYFAMEINGKWREASVVEKTKGRVVFESVVRRRVDPGLLEMTQGNNYRARVFPIPPKGHKRIIISFDQEIFYNGNEFVYYQPMCYTEKMDEFRLHVELVNLDVVPNTTGDSLEELNFTKWENSMVSTREMKQYTPDKPIYIKLPGEAGMQRCFTEKANGDSSYFFLTLTPPVSPKPKVLPKTLCILWDVSGSGAKRDIKKELELIDAYIRRIGDLDLKLVLFNYEVMERMSYTVRGGDWKEGLGRIWNTTYDGASQIGCLDLDQFPCDEFILVSDGMSNFGEEKLKLSATPVICLNTSVSFDASALRSIAQRSNGTYIDATMMSAEAAAAKFLEQPMRFISAVPEEENVTLLTPSMPSDFHKVFTLAGILKGKESNMTINFGTGSTIEYSQKVIIRNTPSLGSPGHMPKEEERVVGRQWARKLINELDLDPVMNKNRITDLGKAFNIITSNTSMLVLEDINDYITYKVEPRDPGMRKQYFNAIAEETKQKDSLDRVHLDDVLKSYEERLIWYEKNFSGVKPLKTGLNGRDTSHIGFRGNMFQTENLMSLSDSTMVTDSVGFAPLPYEEQETGSGTVTVDGIVFSSGRTTNLTVNGGLSPTIYSWNFGHELNPDHVYMSGGTYTVSVTDANGAFDERTVTLEDAIAGNDKKDIKISDWKSEMPYMKALRKTDKKKFYKVYLQQKKKYGNMPSFYLDVSMYFQERGMKRESLRVLSNLAEIQTEDAALLRVLAHRLVQTKRYREGISVFRHVLKIREEEPQSYRDLGLALEAAGQYQEALKMMYTVLERNWDGRFPGIEVIVAGEINHLIGVAGDNIDTKKIDARLKKAMPMDVRIVIDWNTDNCDIDLWVTDPYGFACSYQQKDTPIGGHLSNDFTGGYGPEEFLLKRSRGGEYMAQVHYYASHETTVFSTATVHAVLYTSYGTKDEKKKEITLRLDAEKDVLDLGSVIAQGEE